MRYEQCKGRRLHKRFFCITNVSGLWWNGREWTMDVVKEGGSSCCRCRTIRAFRRHLRKHPEIKGKAILVSLFVGYNVYA